MDGAQANVEVRAEHDRAKSAADDAAVFVPQCLACGYELTGLADGACPECGERFRHAGLIQAHEARQAARVDPAALPAVLSVITFAIGAIFVFEELGRPVNGVLRDLFFGVVLMHLSVLANIAWHRMEKQSPLPRQGGCLGWLVAQALLAVFMPWAAAMLVLAAHAALWFAFKSRAPIVGRVLVGMLSPALSFVAMVFFDACVDRLSGGVWSRWRPGPPGSLPLRTTEVLTLGAAVLIGLAVLIVLTTLFSVIISRARRVKRSSSPPPSSSPYPPG